MTSDRIVIDARFLLDREHAGVSRDALKAIYPRRVWPAEWTDDPKSTTNEEDS